ncbi:acyl-CoA dehydrogenase [Salmonella enterica]|nr:acyl-CoA dehydrogenase [Salmonella enterica]
MGRRAGQLYINESHGAGLLRKNYESIEKDKNQDIRDAVRSLCSEFDDKYHRRIDETKSYPEEFVNTLTKAGWLAALIPEEFGGSGLGLTEASIIMEEINRSGGILEPVMVKCIT